MFHRILVPLDGSAVSEQALPVAKHLWEKGDAEVRFIHVLDFTSPIPRDVENPDDWRGCVTRDAECYLSRSAAQFGGTSLGKVTTVVREGGQVHGILEEAQAWQADLILMATHGRGGIDRVWLGSVADSVVREGKLPVLLIRAQQTTSETFSRFAHVLIAVDDAQLSKQIIQPAVELARIDRSRLTLLHILHPWLAPLQVLANAAGIPEMAEDAIRGRIEDAEPELAETAWSLDASLQDVTAHVQVGQWTVAADILNYASKYGVDLIALATRGRAGLPRAILGSTADEVIRRAQVPVLVLRPGT